MDFDLADSGAGRHHTQVPAWEVSITWEKSRVILKSTRIRLTGVLVGLFLLGLLSLAWLTYPKPAVIDGDDVHQTIDGFGGSCAGYLLPLTPKMEEFLFTSSGIGLSLLRTQVIPSSEECKYYVPPGNGGCVEVKSGATILKGELGTAQQAAALGVKVWSTPWSPPASMKSNKSYIHGGRLLAADYPAWAQSLASYVKLMDSNGVPIYALSIQNEPDFEAYYGSALFNAREIHDFVPYLHSALQSAGEGNTKIMIAESAKWDFSLVRDAMADPAVAADVGIIAAHGYWSTEVSPHPDFGRPVWQTEDSELWHDYNGGMNDAIGWAKKIHTYLTVANVNAWHWWYISNGPPYGAGTDNSALTDINMHYAKRAYVTGQWSRFVRPGWRRIGVRNSSPVRISAFKDSAGTSFAIVVINANWLPVRQTFELKGLITNSVIPWVTSSWVSLAQERPIAVRANRFKYTLSARSVTTFVATGQHRGGS